MKAYIQQRLIQSIDSALSISELKLDYFNQFSEIVAIVASFRVGACVESLYRFNALFLQKWESLNRPNYFSLFMTSPFLTRELKKSTNLKMHLKPSVQDVWQNLDSGSTL